MAEVKVHHAPVSDDPILRARGFWQHYQKPIGYAIAALVIIVGGWFAYKYWVAEPKEERAQEQIFKAQQYFAKDSLNKALNGDGINKGFVYIINNYSGTKTGNLAKYYAGVSYLRLGDNSKAIKYLSDFSTDAKQVQMMAYGCLADAYSETNDKAKAVENYKKAATTFEQDEANSSEYLFRAALLSEVLGKNSEALELYKQLKEKFPASDKGAIADKYIYRLSVQPNE